MTLKLIHRSAITAIWLFVAIVISNSLQARYPATMIPLILFNIFVIVQFTSCSRFRTWKECWDLIYLTIRCYYTGIAISFVSGIIIYPVSCRTEMFEVQEKYLVAVRDLLHGTALYLRELQATPTVSSVPSEETLAESGSARIVERAGLGQKMEGVKALYIKIRAELAMAQREIAWGKLQAGDIANTTDLYREILMPL